MPDLQPNGTPVRIGRSTLRTAGLAGTAVSHAPGSPGMRSAELATGALDDALASQRLQPFETIEITNTREVPTGTGVTRSTTLGEPAIELTVPDPGPDWGQVVLAVDESGSATWNFARDTSGAVDVTRGGATRTYVIRRQVPPPADPSEVAETRGLLGAVGKKVLKVLVFPLIDPVVGEVGERLAARWEATNRPYRLRTFTADDYRTLEASALDGDAWTKLQSGRALLVVHGTFSQAHSGFGGLPGDFVGWLHERYEGRVFAFDHYTLSEDPRQNVDWLVSQMPEGARLDLDIICHSRGGLVSRVLSEQAEALTLGSRHIDVSRIVFLGTPNAGTVLADAEHLGDLVDAVTNVLNFVPDNAVTNVLEAVITVVKQLAVGAVSGLEGLSSMRPEGEFLAALNASPKAAGKYYALAADFEPRQGAGLRTYARNVMRDLIFGADNDLVVPTASAWEVEGSANFPIADRHVFTEADAVTHSGLTRHPVALEHLRNWLA